MADKITNWDHYKDNPEFKELCAQGNIAVTREGRIASCSVLDCCDCQFHCENGPTDCTKRITEWFEEEYQEPEVDWSKVAVDTPVLVSHFKDLPAKLWSRRYFAKYEDGIVYTFIDGCTSWSADGVMIYWKYAKLADDKGKEK